MEQVTENCISLILSFTSPLDTCRASSVSTVFKSAGDSDELWNKFLPSDINRILSRSVSPPFNYTTKRHLYFLLSDSPILLDDGNVVILPLLSFLDFVLFVYLVVQFLFYVLFVGS